MDEYFTNVLKTLATTIVNRIRGSSFCGVLYDESNPDMIIVMAYELGKHDESLRARKDLDDVLDMTGIGRLYP